MPACVVCRNYQGSSNCKGISFHRFPKDDDRLHEWLVAVKSHLKPSMTIDKIRELCSKPCGAYICSDHFSPDCCFENQKAKLLSYKYPTKVLSEDAIPTIFGKSRESSESQRGKRARNQLIQELLQPTTEGHVEDYIMTAAQPPAPINTTASHQPTLTQVSASHPTTLTAIQPSVPSHMHMPTSQQPTHTQLYASHPTIKTELCASHSTTLTAIQPSVPSHMHMPTSQQPTHTQLYASHPTIQPNYMTAIQPSVPSQMHIPTSQQPTHTQLYASHPTIQPNYMTAIQPSVPSHMHMPTSQQPTHTQLYASHPTIKTELCASHSTTQTAIQPSVPSHMHMPTSQPPTHTHLYASHPTIQPNYMTAIQPSVPSHMHIPTSQQPTHTQLYASHPTIQTQLCGSHPTIQPSSITAGQPAAPSHMTAIHPPTQTQLYTSHLDTGPSFTQGTQSTEQDSTHESQHLESTCCSHCILSRSTISMFHSYCKNQSSTDASTQTDPRITATNILTSSPILKDPEPDDHNTSFMTTSSVSTVEGEQDVSYDMSISDSESSSGESASESGEDSINVANINLGRYYLVSERKINELFVGKCCRECGEPVRLVENGRYNTGSALTIKYTCPRDHDETWESQPHVGDTRMFEGNVLLPGAILFAGGTFQKFADIADTLNLQCFGETHYNNVQRTYLFPAVHQYYNAKQEEVLDMFRNNEDTDPDDRVKVTLLGDGRYNSPGHNAKYCSYTFIEETSKYILDFELLQVTDSNSSQAMERDAFGVGLDYLISEGLDIECIATDRHPGIKAELKKPQYRDIHHQFDVYHVSTGIKKKLGAKARKYCNRELSPWISCIANHLWWCSRTCGGDDVLLLEKWTSVTQHVGNTHRFPRNHHFKQCGHAPLSAQDKKDIKWLKPGSPPHRALHEVVNQSSLLKDLPGLTGFKHTGDLEVFHSMLLKYASKQRHFSYLGMRARLQLAAIDHNSNVFREQATTKEGNPKWTAAYSKRATAWTARRVFQSKQYAYRQDLMKLTLKRAASGRYVCGDHVLHDPEAEVPRNIAPVELGSKNELVQNYISRFPTR